MIAPPLSGKILGSVDDAFVLAEWRDGGGPPGPPRLIAPLHVHHLDDEAWYVLEGTLCVQVGKDEVEAQAGSGVFVPRGTAHTYRSEEHTSELQSPDHLVCRLLLEKKKKKH